jgi:hypothetical protein
MKDESDVQEAAGKKKPGKRRTSAPARQKKYVRTSLFKYIFFLCIFGRFSARGVRKHGKTIKCVSQGNHWGNIFSGREYFSGWIFF